MEKIIESKIKKEAQRLGFLTYKFVSPSNRGVPDRMFISKDGIVFFMEFKSMSGRLTEVQRHHIGLLRNYNINTYVVYDVDEGLRILEKYSRNNA